ncbi:MAG: hypothetical protein GY832_02160 [Chloroflexi bacterium]|nr:hypothetical protein [Chloroflexota bacterium]
MKTNALFFDVIQNRRSVRKFKSTPVPKEHVTKMIDAARFAPTAGNQQPWKFLVIRDRAKLDQLKEECLSTSMERYKERENTTTSEEIDAKREEMREYYGEFLSAPVYIVVYVDSNSDYPSYNVHDGPLAASNLILAARALGYGTVFTTDSVPEEVTRKVLGTPDNYKRVCLLPIGVPESWPEVPPKKELDELVFFETFR